MKLKYKTTNKPDGSIEVAIDVPKPIIVTPAIIQDIKQLGFFPGTEKKEAINAAKATLHWEYTKKYLGLPDMISNIRWKYGDACFSKDLETCKTHSTNMMKFLDDFFSIEYGVY